MVGLCVFLRLCERNHAVLREIRLISDEHDSRGRIAQGVHVFEPHICVVKRLLLAVIENPDYADCILEVSFRN
jgi:hypothetical protein